MSDKDDNKPQEEEKSVGQGDGAAAPDPALPSAESTDVVSQAEPKEENASGSGVSRPPKASDAQQDSDSDEPLDYDPMAALSEKREEEEQKKAEAAAEKKEKKIKRDEYAQVVKQSRVQAEKKKKAKRNTILGVLGGFVLMIGGFFTYMMMPYTGGMDFGICKVFLERTVTFPATLELKGIEQFSKSVRIWYMTIDSFGNNRMQPMQCYFKKNEQGYLQLEKVTVRRREMDQEIIDRFNPTIPAIYAHPPDLALPYTAVDTLENLHYEVNQFRKPIL